MKNKQVQEILREALGRINPAPAFKKEIMARIISVIALLNRNLKGAKAVLGGSGVKDTWLKDAYDADIFVKFDLGKFREKSGELSDILEKAVKKCFPKYARIHGSRDYFSIREDGLTIEIIPIISIRRASQALNITDVSPLHSVWVNKMGKRWKDDIRLTKQFCKAARAYGAESFIQGFSGYVCEILAISNKGFFNLLKHAANWKEKTILDPAGLWKGKDILMELNSSKTVSPLVIIDPVQAGRNAAAAVSRENYERFKDACRAFLLNPSLRFFDTSPVAKGSLLKKAGKNHLIILRLEEFEGKRDVVGCQMAKAFEHMKSAFRKNEFEVLEADIEHRDSTVFFIIRKKTLSPAIIREGPPIASRQHADNFRKAHRKVFEKGGRLFAELPRKFREYGDVVRAFHADSYLKQKIKGFSVEWQQ
ncbi:nucleotidyltransferase domain-containing protein [Candidatus Woesearchaeota archaeon]|nr:nucleotidyltransferase domain-containing protein [Candidatus Woesearchaeota archaeon]